MLRACLRELDPIDNLHNQGQLSRQYSLNHFRMAQILQPSRVPVIYYDLSPEETMGDAFYALETLSSTIDDIFNRIEKRISDEKRRVDQIKTRVAVCKSKVNQVRGSKKATTVFSTAKFPAPKLLPSYPTLFSQMQEVNNILL